MTVVQPGPGFLAFLNGAKPTGDLRTAIDDTARTAIETGIDHELSDPYWRIWFNDRDGYSLIASLDENGRVTGAEEMPTDRAIRLHKRLPATTLIITSWGEAP